MTWTDPGNWDQGSLLPGAGDDAVINVAGTPTILHPAGATSIRSLTSEEAILLSGGSLTIGANSSMTGITVDAGAELRLNAQTLGGTGSLINRGTVALVNSTISTAVVNEGEVVAERAASRLSGPLTTTANSALRVRPSNPLFSSTLTV